LYFIVLLYLYCTCDFFFFFFNGTATSEIYTLSLHDALPIWMRAMARICSSPRAWKTTTSSIRFTNSGRKCVLTSAITATLMTARSEERRVGKECRSGGSPVD